MERGVRKNFQREECVANRQTHQQTHHAAFVASHLPPQSLQAQALKPASIRCQLRAPTTIAGSWMSPSPAKSKFEFL
jgi:hypothetical protein